MLIMMLPDELFALLALKLFIIFVLIYLVGLLTFSCIIRIEKKKFKVVEPININFE